MSRGLFTLLLAAWIGLMAAGMKLQMDYERTPGDSGASGAAWPADSAFVRPGSAPRLVLFAHPRCPCTRSTLDVLAELGVPATVAFVRPAGTPADWARGELWSRAAALPRVDVREDVEGREAKRFGARTSGHAFVYDVDGRLRFDGGLTPGRGAAGASEGRRAVTAIFKGGRPSAPSSSVFGCPLD